MTEHNVQNYFSCFHTLYVSLHTSIFMLRIGVAWGFVGDVLGLGAIIVYNVFQL